VYGLDSGLIKTLSLVEDASAIDPLYRYDNL
jgi:hypothetical protein